jgi:hypothetical protein
LHDCDQNTRENKLKEERFFFFFFAHGFRTWLLGPMHLSEGQGGGEYGGTAPLPYVDSKQRGSKWGSGLTFNRTPLVTKSSS